VGDPEPGQALISDADLITAIRSGDMAAYGDLYRRHVAAAQGLARQLVHGPAEVDDVVAETFSKVLDVMRRGGGPQDAFRPYLLTAVRRTAYDKFRGERKNVPTDEIEAFDPGEPFVDPAVAGLERSLIAKAFLSLPERWRAVLWHTEIEGQKPADVAPLLGLTANGVAALAYRAREGLRQAYLQMHLSGVARQECRPVVDKLGAFVRGGLSAREAKVVSDHLDGCRDCRAVYAELADVNVALRGVVAPIFLGPAAAAYIAWATKGGAAAWILGKLLWIRHAPKQQQAAMAAGVAAAAAAIAAALALTGNSTPLHPHRHAAALPAPPSQQATAPAPHHAVHPAHPAPPVHVQSHVTPPKPTPPARPTPVAKPAPPPKPAPPATTPPPSSPPPTSPPPPPPVTLAAHMAPVGALLRNSTGMLTFTVANTGKQAAKQLAATVKLPPGVSYLGGSSGGMSAPMATSVPGGWSCAATAAGARCTHGPLAAGQTTTSYLQVAVSPAASYGVPPSLSVSGAGRIVTASAGTGVVRSGLPARFASVGRLDTVVVGNTLPPCYSWNFGWHPPSSSAQVALPGPVMWAGLYWAGAGDVRQPRISLKGPGGSFQPVSATDTGSTDIYGFPVFQAYANVTSQVAAYGGGTWRAQVPAGVKSPASDTGWSLVVVTQDPSAPVGEAVVVDGAHAVTAFDPNFRVPLNGLLPAGAEAGVQLVTWSGFGYGNDPSLSARHETLPASPAVDLSSGFQPYLVGVVAATTSAETTQAGPPPYAGWPGNRWDGWRVGAGGHPGWSVSSCSFLTRRQMHAAAKTKAASDARRRRSRATGSPSPSTSPSPATSTSPTPSPSPSGPSGPPAPSSGNPSPGSSKPGQDPPLPRRGKPHPNPLCKVLPRLCPSGGVAAQPSPGVPDGVTQRAVAHASQPGAVTGGLPRASQLRDVRGPQRKLAVGLHAGRQQHVVRHPHQLSRRDGVCPGHAQAEVQQLAQGADARPRHVHHPGDAAAGAFQDPGGQVTGVGQPGGPAGVAGGQHTAAPCQPVKPPRKPAAHVVRPGDDPRAHDQVPARESSLDGALGS
jgi:RNA polymerase sigma factor (sigma-70 family)